MEGASGEGTRVILLAKDGDHNTHDLLALFKKSAVQTFVTFELSDFWKHLEKFRYDKIVIVVDLLSTLTKKDDISGYDRFLQQYAEFRRGHNARLVVIRPSAEKMTFPMIGYGALVSAYLLPSTPSGDMLTTILAVAEGIDSTNHCHQPK